jgi:hypothetical protein
MGLARAEDSQAEKWMRRDTEFMDTRDKHKNVGAKGKGIAGSGKGS